MRFIIIIFLGLSFLWSCNPGTGSGGGEKVVSPGGFEYTMFKKGTGKKAAPGDVLTFELHQYVDDSLMVSTRKMGRPQQMQIPPEGSKLMKEQDVLANSTVGDSFRTSIKIDTMAQKPPGFENSGFVHYDFLITKIQSMEEITAEQEAKRKEGEVREKEVADKIQPILANYKSGSLKDLQTHPSGMKYVIHEAGSGRQPQNGQGVEVNYYGTLTDGKMFDNSFGRGEPFTFTVGQGMVIKGWDVGIPLLKEGGKGTLFIPYEMAYGEAGRPPSIPAKSELVFYVELLKVK